MLVIEDVPSIDALTVNGAHVVNIKEPQLLLDGTAYVSGEIPRVTPFETGLPGQHRLAQDGKSWEPDDALKLADALAIAVETAGRAAIVRLLAVDNTEELRTVLTTRPYLPQMIEGFLQSLSLPLAELAHICRDAPLR